MPPTERMIIMTNLNKFKSRLVSDKGLQKRMSEASTIKDVVKIAKSVGCDVTENEVKDDMMKAISGGEIGANPVVTSPVMSPVAPAKALASGAFGAAGGLGVSVGDVNLLDFSSINGSITQTVYGAGSAANTGGVSIATNKG